MVERSDHRRSVPVVRRGDRNCVTGPADAERDPYVRALGLEIEATHLRARLDSIERSFSFRFSRALATSAFRFTRRTPSPVVKRGARPSETRALLVAIGCSRDELANAVAALARAAFEEPMRALVLVSRDDFSPLAGTGLEYDFIPPEDDFAREFPERDYPALVESRIADVSSWFMPSIVIVVGAELLASYPGMLARTVRRSPDG
jgi:hypothetical protein